MGYISACCGADCDTDIMICSECHEHLGDEDIIDEDEDYDEPVEEHQMSRIRISFKKGLHWYTKL